MIPHLPEPAAAPPHDLNRSAISKAVRALASKQGPYGSWKGDYSGPQFLLPMYVGTHHITKTEIHPAESKGMVRYLFDVQNDDGGWGLGIENDSCVFTSVLNYMALRLLGTPADEPNLVRARDWFLPRGGAAGSASWGRFFLCVMNLHSWEGIHPVPPEAWLMPESLPAHPGRMWCHARMVYLPMSWLYANRSTVPVSPLLLAIRSEIWDQPYETVDWKARKSEVADTDAYRPEVRKLNVVNKLLGGVERIGLGPVRRRALKKVIEEIIYEDELTDYVCLGPVNKLFNTLVWHFAEPSGERLRRHLRQLPDYLWTDERGTRMNGYLSSELWDTCFAVQAVLGSGAAHEVPGLLNRAHAYIDANQIRIDPPERDKHWRSQTKGGWTFSTATAPWPVTDCTAEGLKTALLLTDLVPAPIAIERLVDAVDLIVAYQNPDGGWASYEETRGPRWLEQFNPSNIFGDIMIDYSYVECTSACIQALEAFRSRYPSIRSAEIGAAVERGVQFIQRTQRDDGSWEGSWGVCFTYGTWFGIEGLIAAGLPTDHPVVQKAADYLESIQRTDGAWGEHINSCRDRRMVPTQDGQAVMTSWALLGLAAAGRATGAAAQRGAEFLKARQRDDGTWPPEAVAGVFNKTCSIHYDAYLKVFPLWALSSVAPGS